MAGDFEMDHAILLEVCKLIMGKSQTLTRVLSKSVSGDLVSSEGVTTEVRESRLCASGRTWIRGTGSTYYQIRYMVVCQLKYRHVVEHTD